MVKKSCLACPTGGWYFDLAPEPALEPLAEPISVEAVWQPVMYELFLMLLALPERQAHCLRPYLSLVSKKTLRAFQMPVLCKVRWCCPKCGPEWAAAVLAHFWWVWSRQESVWCSARVEFRPPECRVVSEWDLLRDRVGARARELGAQYAAVAGYGFAWFFSTEKLSGRKDPKVWVKASPRAALEHLRSTALALPSMDLSLSTSTGGDWEIPSEIRNRGKGENHWMGFKPQPKFEAQLQDAWEKLAPGQEPPAGDYSGPPTGVAEVDWLRELGIDAPEPQSTIRIDAERHGIEF